jgi:predicted dehydrogenase
MDRLRIGILGAAKIAPAALLRPSRALPDVDVVAVAARDPERARVFATKYGIERVLPTYAVYNPLPNGLHGRWTLAALAASKHVLCEKPFTANAEEATTVSRAGDQAGVVVMEAFHYRHHPLATRMREVVEQGLIGEVRHIDAWMCFPLLNRKDIRYRLDLAGGATMDAGCYAVNMIRFRAHGGLGPGQAVVAGRGPSHGGRPLLRRRSDRPYAHLDAVIEPAASERTGHRRWGRAPSAQSGIPPALSSVGGADTGGQTG